MAFSALMNESQLTGFALRAFHDCDVAVATSTKIVRGVFVAAATATSQYHQTARDTAGVPAAGVAMETVDNTATSASAPYATIRVATRGLGVFPILSNATACNPDQALYVFNASGNGNILTDTGNVQVGRTVCTCRGDGEIDPSSASHVWVDFDPKKY